MHDAGALRSVHIAEHGRDLSAVSKTTARETYPFLETLRGFASVFVLLMHTRNWIFEVTTLAAVNKALLPFYFFTALGRESVIVFFVVSGFLVGGRAMIAIEEHRFSTLDYFAARISRIYIAYIPALLVTFLLMELVWRSDAAEVASMSQALLIEHVPNMGGARALACHLANFQDVFCPYTQANPALWSQGYEWVLYLVAPVLIAIVASQQAPRVRIALVLLFIAGLLALVMNPLRALVLGGVWFLGAASYRRLMRFGPSRTHPAVPLGAFCVFVLIARLKVWHPYLTDALVGAALIWAITCPGVLKISVLPRLSQFFASFSFSLYVTHMPVGFAVFFFMRQAGIAYQPAAMGIRPLLDFGFLLICCIAFAYGFSRMTEAHTGRLRKWLLAKSVARRRPEAI